VVPVLLEPEGLAALRRRCKIRVGMPVHPMLAQPTKGVGEVLTRLESVGFTCEYKYDGERAQVHVIGSGAGRTVHIYSRNLEDNT
jgi:DNA ligase-1